jgi:D-arginine dehydrogenase
MSDYDVAIIGAGMAGASLAAEIAAHRRTIILEAEEMPGYHATGRSAAFWHETYGGPGVHPLSLASLDWLTNPPAETGSSGFLSPRGVVTLGRAEDQAALDDYIAAFQNTDIVFVPMDRAALDAHCPGLRPEWERGFYEPACADIDVAGLHQAYLKIAKQHGAAVQCRAGVDGLHRTSTGWQIATRAGPVTAAIIVNAAGAWADEVAALGGVNPIAIAPYRRTMAQVRFAESVPADLPLMFDVSGSLYFKGDGAGGIWLSPHDEIPGPACDAAPDEIDVAIAIDRLEHIVTWQVKKIEHRWAGLRSFAPDRLPVYGYDPDSEGFFWCAGQGGYGIQTAPAAAKLAAALLLGKTPDPMVAHIDALPYSPCRFRD